jgi:uncharacterized protein
MNAVNWFEIPVLDMDRAQGFYENLLAKPLKREAMGGQTMAFFPHEGDQSVGGALVSGQPSRDGSLVYLNLVQSTPLDQVLARVGPAGGTISLPRTALPEGMGVIAHVIDTEGNRVGLHAMD